MSDSISRSCSRVPPRLKPLASRINEGADKGADDVTLPAGADDMSPGWTATDEVAARQPRFGGSMQRDTTFPTGAARVGTSLGLGGEVDGSAGNAENADAAVTTTAAGAGPKLSIYDDWEGDDDDDFCGVI